jgi:hypothetical protein
MSKDCFYSGVVGTDQAKNGVFWLSQNSKPNGGWLALDAIDVLRNLSRHSGLERLKELLDRRKHRVMIHGVTIELITKTTIPKDGKGRPLVAVEPSKDFLEELDVIPHISLMLVVPFIVDEVDDWAKRNDAKRFGRFGSYDNSSSEKGHVVDNVTKAALRDLTHAIFPSSERNPVNRNQHVIISTLYLLQENGYDSDPAAIKYCLMHDYGWKPVSATLVEEYADVMRTGERYSGLETQYWKGDTIGRWREDARRT